MADVIPKRATYADIEAAPERAQHYGPERRINVGLSILLVACVFAIWLYFRS